MTSIGMCSLFYTSITANPIPVPAVDTESETKSKSVEKPMYRKNRSQSNVPGLYTYMANPRETIQRYLFGFHPKTKRTLAEEAESGDEISVNSWIRDGVNPDQLDGYGYTPLLNASALGRLQAVKELIKSGANVNRTGPFGFTALHAAAQNGHREVVSVLLNNGANINSQNLDMDTPMHLAIRSYRIEIVYMLLRNGASSRIEGFNKKDCIQCAKESCLLDLAETLKNYHPFTGYHTHSAPAYMSNKNTVF